MTIQLQEVLKTDTLEIQRQKFNQVALDIFNTLAGGTDLNVGTVGLADGTKSAPALYFGNDPSLGLYRKSDYNLEFVTNNNSILSLGYPTYNPQGVNVAKALFYRDINLVTDSGLVGFTITDFGRGYSTKIDENEIVSTYTNVPLTTVSGQGAGATADIEITAFGGNITNPGTNYNPGTYNNTSLINVNRTTITASGSIINGGSGYTVGSYTNVPATGGSGTGMTFNITVSGGGGAAVAVTAVTIVNYGQGYLKNDTLSVESSSIGGSGSGFSYRLDSYNPIASGAFADITVSGISGSITSPGSGYDSGNYLDIPLTGGSGSGATANIQIPDSGDGTGPVVGVTILSSGQNYQEGDILSLNAASIGNGTGSGFQYTINTYGRVSAVNVVSIGENYDIGDILTADPFILGTIDSEIFSPGSGYVPGTYSGIALSSGNGTGFEVDITVTGNMVISGSTTSQGSGYVNGTYSNVVLVNAPTQTFNVAVVPNPNAGQPFEPANIFTIDGTNQPDLNLSRGNTYRFNISDPSMSGHPFVIQPGGIATSLPAGVNTVTKGSSGLSGSFVDLIISNDVLVPVGVSYDCSIHDGMGSGITITDSGSENSFGFGAVANITVSGNSVTSVSILSSGDDYKSGDILYAYSGDLGGSGSGFSYTLSSISYNSSVTGAVVTNVGSGYSNGDLLTVNNSLLGGSGSGFQYLINSYFSGSGFEYTLNYYGSISDFTLVSSGSNYSVGNVLSVDPTSVGSISSDILESFSLNTTSIGQVSTTIQKTSGESLFKKVGIGIPESSLPLENNNPNNPQSVDLLVKGISTFRDSLELKNGSVNSLALRFEDKPNVGMFSEGTSDSFSFRTDSGVNIQFSDDATRVFKDFNFSVRQFTSLDIIGGSGYDQGFITDVPLSGGSGTGLRANVLVAFGVNISNSGSGYGSEATYEGVDLVGGSGQGALATVTILNGSVIDVIITSQGNGQYNLYDVLQITAGNLALQGGPGTGSGASVTINTIGSVSTVSIEEYGSGYQLGDVLTFNTNTENSLGGSGFKLIIQGTTDIDKGKYNISEGIFENYGFKSTGIGFNFSDILRINNDTIEKISSGSLKLKPFGSGAQQGIVEVNGTSAFKVPVGTTSQRPQIPVSGSIRFNTTSGSYEAYDGANWGSLGGTRDVDGNTYILPESSPGANENVLFFYNDGVNSLDVEQTKIKLYTATSIESLISGTNVVQWESGGSATAATLPNINYVYWNENLYSVDTTGTLGTSAPTHTSGTVTNGTVDLTYVSSIYGTFNLAASSVNVDIDTTLSINGGLIFSSDFDTNTSTIGRFTNDLKIGDGDLTQTPEGTLLKFTNSGEIQVNRNYGSSETYTTVLDSSLRTFELTDLHTVSGKTTLIKGTTNTSSSTLYNPTTSSGSKVTVFADNTTTGQKEVIELSVIDNGSDIYNIEIGDLYTSSKLIDVVLDYDGSNNVRITYTLDAAVATGNSVVVTVVSQRIKK